MHLQCYKVGIFTQLLYLNAILRLLYFTQLSPFIATFYYYSTSQVSFIYIAHYHSSQICLWGKFGALQSVQQTMPSVLRPLKRTRKKPKKKKTFKNQLGKKMEKKLRMSNRGGFPLPW